MGKCLRCGKEIDLIMKENGDIFYCKECSMKILKIGNIEEKKEYKNYKKKNSKIYFLFPGFFQMKINKIFRSLVYIFSFYIIPLFWFLFLYSIVKIDIFLEKIKIMGYIVSFFIILNMFFLIVTNIVEVLKEEK